MSGRRVLLLATISLAGFLVIAPASASALCFGEAATLPPGTAAGETITGTAGDDVIEAGDGDDIVNGGGGVDRICGEGGDDTINGQGGDDQLDGGGNSAVGDTVTFVDITVGQGPSLTIDLVAGTAVGGNPINTTDTLTGFENVTGSSTFDILFGDEGANVLTGLAAADSFTGRGGDDTLVDPAFPVDQGPAKYPDATGPITATVGDGSHTVTAPGVGTDTLINVRGIEGSPFGDHLTGDGSVNPNSLTGSEGDDVLEPLGGADTLNGGLGNDRVIYANEATVTVDLSASSGITSTGTDTLDFIENVTGSPGDDTITGDLMANVLDGHGGNDALTGGDGVDTASFAELAQGVDASLATGDATGQGTDTLATIENLTGSSEGDTLTGGGTANVLSGLGGADNVTGGLGVDTYLLGAGADVIAAVDSEADSIDCAGGGPDSGTVDGPDPLETYSDCDSDADTFVDFLDACPTAAGPGPSGCPPATPPATSPVADPLPLPVPVAGTKCKKGFVKKKIKGKKKCVKKKKK